MLSFLLFNVWLLPFGFFISLSVNESTLPDRLSSQGGSTGFPSFGGLGGDGKRV